MLIGKTIALRPTTPADLPLLAEWSNDPEFTGPAFNHWPTTVEMEQKAFTPSGFEHEREAFLIVSRATGEPLGRIGFNNPFTLKAFQAKEIWYTVHPKFRRQGLATQAACLLVNHLFDATPVNRLQATVVVGNPGSGRVVEHAGLRAEGVYRGLLFLHGRYQDMHLYSIVRADWQDDATYRAGRAEF